MALVESDPPTPRASWRHRKERRLRRGQRFDDLVAQVWARLVDHVASVSGVPRSYLDPQGQGAGGPARSRRRSPRARTTQKKSEKG